MFKFKEGLINPAAVAWMTEVKSPDSANYSFFEVVLMGIERTVICRYDSKIDADSAHHELATRVSDCIAQ